MSSQGEKNQWEFYATINWLKELKKKNNSLLILAICTHRITADEQAQTSNKLWAKSNISL